MPKKNKTKFQEWLEKMVKKTLPESPPDYGYGYYGQNAVQPWMNTGYQPNWSRIRGDMVFLLEVWASLKVAAITWFQLWNNTPGSMDRLSITERLCPARRTTNAEAVWADEL